MKESEYQLVAKDLHNFVPMLSYFKRTKVEENTELPSGKKFKSPHSSKVNEISARILSRSKISINQKAWQCTVSTDTLPCSGNKKVSGECSMRVCSCRVVCSWGFSLIGVVVIATHYSYLAVADARRPTPRHMKLSPPAWMIDPLRPFSLNKLKYMHIKLLLGTFKQVSLARLAPTPPRARSNEWQTGTTIIIVLSLSSLMSRID